MCGLKSSIRLINCFSILFVDVAANMNNTRLQEGNQRTSTYSMEDDDSVMGSIDSDVDEYDSSDYLGTTSEDDGVDSSQGKGNDGLIP